MSFNRWTLASLIIALSISVVAADDLTTAGGKKLTGKLISIDASGATFLAGETKATIQGKEIVVIDLGRKVEPLPKDARLTEIELTDGSTIRAAKFQIKGRKVITELLTVPNGVTPPVLEIPIESVFSIMRNAEEPKSREAWRKVLGTRGKRDLYVVREPEGLNFIQGTILSGTDAGNELNFEKEDGTKQTLLLRAATGGLVFSQPTPAQVPPTLCKVIDVFGNSFVAQSVKLGSEGATVTTVSGLAVQYTDPQSLAKFDYAQGNVAYLSDLDPQADAPEPPPEEKGLRLNVISPYTRDRGLSGEPLKLGTDTFAKGLMVGPDTVLTFPITGDYREFKAIVGLPEQSPDASLEAKLTLEADGRIVFSEILRRKDKPRPIVLDIKGVRQLRVIVDADIPLNGNRVILADARIQK